MEAFLISCHNYTRMQQQAWFHAFFQLVSPPQIETFVRHCLYYSLASSGYNNGM